MATMTSPMKPNTVTIILCDSNGNEHPSTLPLPESTFAAHGVCHWSVHLAGVFRMLIELLLRDMDLTIPRPSTGKEEV
jgi:hypothetical protein